MRKSGKESKKWAHVLPVFLEKGNQDGDTNLVALLDMPLLHRQVAHGDNHAENLIHLKHDCSSFVSSTLDTRDSYMVTFSPGGKRGQLSAPHGKNYCKVAYMVTFSLSRENKFRKKKIVGTKHSVLRKMK
jgi:hypothetical protein